MENSTENSIIENYHTLGYNKNIKVHFHYSHLDKFPKNVGDISKEQVERCHQDTIEMHRRYQRQRHLSINMITTVSDCNPKYLKIWT